jgi:hypothetical protein
VQNFNTSYFAFLTEGQKKTHTDIFFNDVIRRRQNKL